MVKQISVTKNIPSSSWYTGSGSTTINIYAEEITINTKKSLIKVQQAQAPSSQNSNQSDKGKSYINDLKRIEDTIIARGFIPDETGSTTAWNRAWQLRAMCSSGNIGGDKGALSSLIIDNLTFSSATQSAFLEGVTIKAVPAIDNIQLSTYKSEGFARMEVSLDFYIGDVK